MSLVEHWATAGVVIMGPSGIVDFSASKQYVWIDRVTNHVANSTLELSYREFTKYRPSATTFMERHYDSSASPAVYSPAPTVSAGGLGVAYPTSILGGAIISGSGYITQISPDPDPIVGSSCYLEYDDASNYMSYLSTVGEQLWTVITWYDSVTETLTDPEDPEWADEEFEEP